MFVSRKALGMKALPVEFPASLHSASGIPAELKEPLHRGAPAFRNIQLSRLLRQEAADHGVHRGLFLRSENLDLFQDLVLDGESDVLCHGSAPFVTQYTC